MESGGKAKWTARPACFRRITSSRSVTYKWARHNVSTRAIVLGRKYALRFETEIEWASECRVVKHRDSYTSNTALSAPTC